MSSASAFLGPTKPISVVKKRILTTFRKQAHVDSHDDTMDWHDLCHVLQSLDAAYCTNERLQELRRSAGNIVIEHPGMTRPRIKLEAFINWIFVDAEVVRTNVEAGNLAYPVSSEILRKAQGLVEEVSQCNELDPSNNVQQVLRKLWPDSCSPKWQKRGELRDPTRRMLVVYTDLEPDDIMAVAQLWEWKRQCTKTDGEPLLITHANFKSHDGGSILEKKQLLVALFLGLSKYYTLSQEGDAGSDVFELEGTVHPQSRLVYEARQQQLLEICKELESFDGELIDFYIMAPGMGNLSAIVRTLNYVGWPSRAKWRVSVYSGSFNVRGTTPQDFDAIKEIMKRADEPLYDVAKFSFFGGKNCHPWTDSLTTFAMPSFAQDLAQRWPVHAAMLKLFNDEFNATLIHPTNKIFRKDAVMTPEEQARFNKISVKYNHRDPAALQDYAAAIMSDAGIVDNLKEFKKSTFKAFAKGACDSPLCDQLLFLHEWIAQERPNFMAYQEGEWRVDRENGWTVVEEVGSGMSSTCRARRPLLLMPRQEENLVEMRDALETFLLRHLYALDCHIAKVPGMLVYSVTKSYRDKLSEMIQKVRHQADGATVYDIIPQYIPPSSWHPFVGPSLDTADRLTIFYTDLEPDDAMAIAQLWEWKMEVQKMVTEPIVILGLDFKSKDGGTILEKKELLLGLMLGTSHHFTLVPSWDNGQEVFDLTGEVHPRNRLLQERRKAELEGICEAIRSFKGSIVDLYIMAPGHGNIGDIVDRLQVRGWPLPQRPKWTVSLYSGQNNMKSMLKEDVLALSVLMNESCGEPLVDLAKFPFFGGKACHPWTDSLTTFASPSLARDISKWSFLACLLKDFNDEFNVGLINPKNRDFFKANRLTPEEEVRYKSYVEPFDYRSAESVQTFCQNMCRDIPVFTKLPEFKKSTFRAFAHGGCDSPLCDQLLFVYEYLKVKNPGALSAKQGKWFFDPSSAYFTKLQEEGRFPALQPTLREPLDEVILTELRHVTEKYLLQHVDEIRHRAERVTSYRARVGPSV